MKDQQISVDDDTDFTKYIEVLSSQYTVSNRILFINPPQFDVNNIDLDIVNKRGYYMYPPMGLLYLISSLREMPVTADIIDLNFEVIRLIQQCKSCDSELWKTVLRHKIDEFRPSIIGVSCMFSTMKKSYETLLQFLREEYRFIIITGGSHTTFEFEGMLQRNLCDFAFVREGENSLPYFLDKLLSLNVSKQQTRGIFYTEQGKIKETAGYDTPPDFDINITKAYDLINIEEYCDIGSLNQYSRIVSQNAKFSTLHMNRGCRAHCAFCTTRSLMGRGIRSRGINTLIEEIKYLKDKRGIVQFDWLDDDLLADRKKFILLCEKIIDEKLNIKWYAHNGLIASSIDEDMLQLMVGSGCIGFKIGIESGNPEIRKVIRKPSSTSKLIELSKKINKFPCLFVAGNYIIGFPQETFGQMIDTFVFANKMSLDWSGYYLFQPLKGTDYYNSFNEFDGIRQDNFIPTCDYDYNSGGVQQMVFSGLDIFKIDGYSVLNNAQLKEVWFAFSFFTNFINNKNLYHRSSVVKFLRWVGAAMSAYPMDAGMSLFLYLGYTMLDDLTKATEYYNLTQELLNNDYWQSRFKQFMLFPAIVRQYTNGTQVTDFLSSVKEVVYSSLPDNKMLV